MPAADEDGASDPMVIVYNTVDQDDNKKRMKDAERKTKVVESGATPSPLEVSDAIVLPSCGVVFKGAGSEKPHGMGKKSLQKSCPSSINTFQTKRQESVEELLCKSLILNI